MASFQGNLYFSALLFFLITGGGQFVLADEPISYSYEILGVDRELEKNIRGFLQIQEPGLLTARSISNFHEEAVELIPQAMSALGYYEPVISDNLIAKDKGFVSMFMIQPGKAVIVDDIQVLIKGAARDDPLVQAVVSAFPLKQSDVLHHGKYEQGKARLADIAVSRGYFDARYVKSKVNVELKNYACDIQLVFDSGARYRFGDVVFEKGALDQSFLERFLPFSRGDYYDAGLLLKLRQTLINSGYFRSVRIERDPAQADNQYIPIQVSYQLKGKYYYSMGLGFGTDTGPRLSGSVDNRRRGSFGQRYQIDTLFSSVHTELGFNYQIPLDTPLTDRYEISLGYQNDDMDDIYSELTMAQFKRVYVKEDRWTRTWYLKLHQETFEAGNTSGNAFLVIPGFRWQQTKSDDPIFPRHGFRWMIDISAGEENLFSDISFFQTLLKTKWIISPFERTRLILRGDAGATWSNDFDQLPVSLRFFAGGDQSVRGYDYRKLGPEDDGQLVGGKYLMVGSAEFEYQLAEKWLVAVFIDEGNAFDRFDESLKNSVGLGVRWLSPIGPVRADIAYPTTDQDRGFKLHIYIGPDL